MGITVSNLAEFNAALAKAKPGDQICLKSGTYKGANISGRAWNGPITIGAADPEHRPVLQECRWTKAGGIILAGVDILVSQTAPYQIGLLLDTCADVQVIDCKAYGGNKGSQGGGFAIKLLGCVSCTVQHTDIADVGYCVSAQRCSALNILDNVLHRFGEDAIQGFSCQDVTVDGNEIFDSLPVPGAHNDAIQFQDGGAVKPSQRIAITDNLIRRGAGAGMQGAFVSNPIPGSFQGMTIADNVIVGTSYDSGINVMGASGTMMRNTVVGVGNDAVYLRAGQGFGAPLDPSNKAETGSFPKGFTVVPRPASEKALANAWRDARRS